MTTYEPKPPKCENGTCTPLDQCDKKISTNNDVLHFCRKCTNIVNPPKCTGGCVPWEACIIRTSKAGKEYRVCAVCKNLTFDPSKPKTPYGGGGQKRSYGAVGAAPETTTPSSSALDAFIAELRQAISELRIAINNINTRVGVLEMKVAISKAHETSSQSTH
jgi:hypothetical protein